MLKKIVAVTLITFLHADINKGKDVYLKNCATCHSIKMEGGMGKDFNIVSYTRTKKEIIQYASNPSKYFKQFGYSSNAMPTLQLNYQDIEDVADFINSLQPFKKWMVKKN